MVRTARLGAMCTLAVAVALTGCTDSGSKGSSSIRDGGSTPSPSTAVTAPPTTSDPRKAMPVITPAEVGTIGYGTASAKDKQRFRAVKKASANLITSSSVSTLTVAGHDVGAVAVYSTKPGVANSTMFQDQYVVQLLNVVASSKSPPRFVRARGKVMALSTGSTAMAAWFEGDRVILVYRDSKTPDLAALAQGVRATPPSG
jgi:hypothetical protein